MSDSGWVDWGRIVPISQEDADIEVSWALPLEKALEIVGQMLVYESGDGAVITRRVVDITPTGEDGLSWDLVLEKP